MRTRDKLIIVFIYVILSVKASATVSPDFDGRNDYFTLFILTVKLTEEPSGLRVFRGAGGKKGFPHGEASSDVKGTICATEREKF